MWGRIVWAVDEAGKSDARKSFEKLSMRDKAKMQALFNRFAEHGEIRNTEQFKKVQDLQGETIWEFKRSQIRFLGGLTRNREFVVAHGLQKQQQKLPKEAIKRAARILSEHREGEARRRRSDAGGRVPARK